MLVSFVWGVAGTSVWGDPKCQLKSMALAVAGLVLLITGIGGLAYFGSPDADAKGDGDDVGLMSVNVDDDGSVENRKLLRDDDTVRAPSTRVDAWSAADAARRGAVSPDAIGVDVRRGGDGDGDSDDRRGDRDGGSRRGGRNSDAHSGDGRGGDGSGGSDDDTPVLASLRVGERATGTDAHASPHSRPSLSSVCHRALPC